PRACASGPPARVGPSRRSDLARPILVRSRLGAGLAEQDPGGDPRRRAAAGAAELVGTVRELVLVEARDAPDEGGVHTKRDGGSLRNLRRKVLSRGTAAWH